MLFTGDTLCVLQRMTRLMSSVLIFTMESWSYCWTMMTK